MSRSQPKWCKYRLYNGNNPKNLKATAMADNPIVKDHTKHPQRKPYRLKQTGTADTGQPIFTAHCRDETTYAQELLDTTGCSEYNTALHLINQVCQAQHQDMTDTTVNVFTDLINSVRPQDPVEGMLAVQMVTCHNLAMAFASRASITGQPSQGIDSNLNRSLKLMRLFGQHLETLNKHRQKGQQTIQVQHVHMNGVQQAIVGQAGG
jgi:hypothetical protein